jgi:PAS domain S-box-containing protein
MTQGGWSDLFDLVHESIFVRDLEGRILSWNAASEKLYGWSQDQALGRDAGDLLGTQADQSSKEIEKILLAEGAWAGRLRRRTARGEERVVQARLSMRRGPDGAPAEVVEIGDDLTERLKAQNALAAAERRYTNLFQAMAASFWELDFAPVGEMLRALRKQGVTDLRAYFEANPAFVRDMMRATRILDVNEETVKLFGGGDRSLLRGSVEPFWPEPATFVYAASVVAAVSGAPSFSTETRLRRANGEEFDALFTACFAPEAVGRGTLLIGVIDISERVEALRSLKVREASHRYLFDYMPVSLWQIDSQALAPFYVDAKAQGVVDFDTHLQAHPDIFEQMLAGLRCEGVNPKTLELFGGSDVSEFVGPIAYFWRQRPDSLRRSMAARYNGASHHTEETQLRTLDGREIDVLYVITWPTGVAEGRAGIAGIVDITERVRAQSAERRLRDEFAHSARISMLGELTASIAHEVN